jgi:threonine dehydrogenase-like Zn-dependent dehydrogenase
MPEDVPKPRLVESRDVILKVTGSTVCGSDLHLLHGAIVELEKGDILGHEFCGVVESMGPSVTGLKKGDRVVASFQIACGDVGIFLVLFLSLQLTVSVLLLQ